MQAFQLSEVVIYGIYKPRKFGWTLKPLTKEEIATKIQNEMTYPGQVKITVIRETRSVAYAK